MASLRKTTQGSSETWNFNEASAVLQLLVSVLLLKDKGVVTTKSLPKVIPGINFRGNEKQREKKN